MSDTNALLVLWAKKRTEPLPEVHYPLLFHMLDVAIVAQELLNMSLHHGTRHFFSRQLGLQEAEASALVSFWAGLHDIGKASPVFQRKSEAAREQLYSAGLVFEPHVGDIPHGIITASVLPEITDSALSENGFPHEMYPFIGYAIGGHHGNLSINDPKRRQKGDSGWNDIRKGLTLELAKLLNISALSAYQNVDDTAFYVMLAGLTSVADWIGSSEQFFPLEVQDTQDEHVEYAHRQAEKALYSLGWQGWKLPYETSTFKELFPKIIDKPRPLQEKVRQLAETLTASPGLVIIEAPMGEGKTEAAMYIADCWTVTLGQKGTYFALPTQATSNQMFGRVREYLETRYPNMADSLRLIHGAALLSDDITKLRITINQDGDNDAHLPSVSAAEWFLPKKRGLLAPFGVGTVDQALMAVLQTRHFFVRLFGLGQKTVIIDEVHAYDMYMSTLVEELIGWLRAIDTSVILLSATLPERKRKALVKAYGGNTTQLGTSTYPSVTWVSEAGVIVDGFEATRHFELHIRHINDDSETLIDNLSNKITEDGCIAIVCNTVKRAQEAYKAIKEAGLVNPDELMLLHSRYPYEERLERESAVLRNVGKGYKRPKRSVLVATQIIEQSLDVDFDLMVTDLAPADLVIQRAGRIHRHNNPRPPSMAEPSLWIRMPQIDANGLPTFGASAYVYEEYFLLLSYLHLKDRASILIPSEIQGIIEKVYGNPEGPWPSHAFKKAVDAARNDMEKKTQRDESIARVNLIPKYDERDLLDFISYSSRELEDDNPELHRSLQALTRLVEPSVSVVCVCKSIDGVYLRESDKKPVDIGQTPVGELTKNFLQRSLTVSDKRVVFELIKQEPPDAWKRSPALRHHRLLQFENGTTTIGKYTLYLDRELGLLIE